jgi:hypothetical protein
MMIRLLALVGLAFLTLTAIGSAQSPKSKIPPSDEQDIDTAISGWAAGHEEFVTPSARRVLFIRVAMAQARTSKTPDREKTQCQVDPKTGIMACAYWGSETVAASARDFVLFYLQTFPTIILNIKPVPPTDYVVKINSDDCDFSLRKNMYRVPPGNAVVIVTRPGAKACRWEGSLQSGSHQTVDCDF